MTRYLLGLLGAIGCIISLFLPFERHKATFPIVMADGLNYEIASAPLLSFAPLLALLIAAATLAFGILLHREDEEKVRLAAWVLCSVSALALLHGVRQIVMRDDTFWKSGMPYYLGLGGGPAIGVAWLTLAVSTTCCLVASRMHDSGFSLRAWWPILTSQHGDTGKCLQCGQPNSTMATICHSCRASLPWAKPAKSQSNSSSRVNVSPRPAANVDMTQWLQTASGQVLTFVFCFAVPFLDFFLWKYMDKEDSPYAGIACIGWIVGLIFHVGRFAWKFVQIGSSLN